MSENLDLVRSIMRAVCTVRFHINDALWRKLRAALKQTNVHAVAGNYGRAAGR
jgi:hypothetical protein